MLNLLLMCSSGGNGGDDQMGCRGEVESQVGDDVKDGPGWVVVCLRLRGDSSQGGWPTVTIGNRAARDVITARRRRAATQRDADEYD